MHGQADNGIPTGRRLSPLFEWDFPARLLPTRRDPTSERLSDAMDRALLGGLRDIEAMRRPGAPPPGLAKALRTYHDAFGQFLSYNLSANGIQMSCGRGCARCCHHFVTSVHASEVLVIYEALRQREDLESLIEQCRERATDFDGWRAFAEETYSEKSAKDQDDLALEHYYDEGNPCPFLAHDGTCGIYEIRPTTCRMYMATSAQRYCEPEQTHEDASDIFTLPPDESIAARMAQLDLATDYWGHTPDLFRSLAKLHQWRLRWGE